MTRLTAGQRVTVSGRRMLVVRVETIDGVAYVWVRRQAAEMAKAA